MESRARMNQTKRRILVVDDNLEGAEILSIMLEHFGNEVRITSRGDEALDIADTFQPHVVFLDLDMPRMSGYDVCRLLREKPGGGEILIAALTGWEREEDRRRTREAGFDMHLVKPVGPDAMRQILEGLPPGRKT